MRCEIIGFPNYEYDLSTGDIISRGQRHTTLKIQRRAHRNVREVMMTQQGKRRSGQHDHPAHGFHPEMRAQQKIQAQSNSDCQQRKNELSQRQSEKHGFRVITDFAVDFFFFF